MCLLLISPWQIFSPSSLLHIHSVKVVLCCSKGEAAGLCQLHVSYIRATPRWFSYVRNISSSGPNEFSLPPPSQRCFTQQEGQVQKPEQGDKQRENILLLVCLAKKTSSYRGETIQMALTTGRQTHGLGGKQIKKGKKGGGKERGKEGKKETAKDSQTDSQTDSVSARGVGLRDKNPLDIATWTGLTFSRSPSPPIPPSLPLPPLSPCSYMLACADHLGGRGLFLQRDPQCQLPTLTDLGLWKALLPLLQTQ